MPCDLALKSQTLTHTVPSLLPDQIGIWILCSHVNPPSPFHI